MRTSWNNYGKMGYDIRNTVSAKCACGALASQVTPLRVRIAGLLVVIGALFCLQQALLWEIWSCEECASLQCTEAVFDVPGSTWSNVYQDEQVKQGCGVHEQSDKEWKHISQSFHKAEKTAPDIITKCGKIRPELISYRTKHTVDPKNFTKIPNIVHYVSFNAYNFSFLHYLSVLSVHKNAKPKFIYFHGDTLPVGPWWERTVQDVANLYFVRRERTVRIQGYKTPWIEHSSNIIRMLTLWENGGIYLDTDILVLKPFTELLQQDFVLGRVTPMSVGNGLILSRPHAPFMCMWLNNYRTYQPWPWAFSHNGGEVAHQLAKAIPEHIHIEVGTVHNPNALHANLLYRGHMDWSGSYTMHIWKRQGHVPDSPEETLGLDTTLGEVMRYVYFGEKRLREEGDGVYVGPGGSGMRFWDLMVRGLIT